MASRHPGRGTAAIAPVEVEKEAPRQVEYTPGVEPLPKDEASADRDRHRYRVADHDDATVIVCGNAPNIAVYVERGLTVNARGRKKYGPQTIFLDGVYTGAPFCDNETRQYSLDHHADCVRGFTLATCEQAVVMLLQGLPLSMGSWNVYVNDPDLDSLLATWVLVNHAELLRDDRALLRKVMPLIRMEGVIDAHGNDYDVLTGFPPAVQENLRSKLDRLMAEERALKGAGKWHSADWHAYTQSTLELMDEMMFPDADLDELYEIQESGRVELQGGRAAVLIESELGIYEVESRLKKRFGASLGVIVLETGPGRFTLRLVDAFMPKDLSAVYKSLNRRDPRSERGNQWGGSGEIGGSPRGTGTGLTGEEILEVVEQLMGTKQHWLRRLLASVFSRWRKQSRRALTDGTD